MNAKSLRWDDFRIVLAIGTTNSLSGAAKVTGLSHATIFRRLADMEDRIGVSLFWKNREGYLPTEVGQEVLSTASRIEDEITECQRKISGQDMSLEGSIRITTTDTLLHVIVGKYINEFLQIHPKIKIELITTNKLLDLSRRDADIAIRPLDLPNKSIVGRKVGRILQAIYTHLDNPVIDGEMDFSVSFIGPDIEMEYSRLEKWFLESGMSEQYFIKTNSILSDFSLLRSGYGYAVLPCYLGDSDSTLKRASSPIDELSCDLWILTHPDLRRTIKIQVFMEFISAKLAHAFA